MTVTYTIPPRAGTTLLVAASNALGSSITRADYACTGTNDDVQINLALAAVAVLGGTVRLSEGAYSLSNYLLIASNTRLIVDPGATLTMQAASHASMLRNTCSVASRTVTDAVTTAASATVTSATANFTNADVGKNIGVIGAGPNYGLSTAPASLYGTITTVNSTTSIVVSAVATLAVTGATLSIFPARDTNIQVEGGIWNHGNIDADNQILAGHCFYLRRIDGLKIFNMTQKSNGSSGIGGKYALAIGDCNKVVVEKIDFNTSGDGVHLTGPAQYVTVRDITGTTGDDFVAFTCLDGQSYANTLLGDIYGNFADCLVDNLQPKGAWTCLKISGGTQSGNTTTPITNFKARGMFGTTVQGAVNIQDYAGVTTFNGEIDTVTTIPGTNFAQVRLAATGAGQIVIRGVKYPNIATPTSGVIQIVSNATAVLIKDLEVLYSGSTGGPIVLLATSFVRHLTIDGVSIPNNPTGSVDLLRITGASTVVSELRITNVFKSGSFGAVISCPSGATNYNLKIILDNIVSWTAGNVIACTADSTNVLYVTASNLRTGASGIGAVIFTLQSPAQIYLTNVIHSTNAAAAIVANDAAATPIRVWASGLTLSSGALFSRTASQSLSGTGLVVSADLSILTPTDQDIVNNTNGALSCGAGLCIFHTGGTGNGWKNLYSGSTY